MKSIQPMRALSPATVSDRTSIFIFIGLPMSSQDFDLACAELNQIIELGPDD